MNGFVTRPSSTTGNHSYGSILDLILTNHEALIDNVTIMPGGFDSGHIPVTFTIKSSFNHLKNVSRMVYSYRKADFYGLRATLSCIPWDACFSANDVNSSVEIWLRIIYQSPCCLLSASARRRSYIMLFSHMYSFIFK